MNKIKSNSLTTFLRESLLYKTGAPFLLRSIILAVVLLLVPAISSAGTYLDLEDEAYSLFARLEAEGVITSGLLSTKPVSRAEAQRLLHEAEQNVEGKSDFLKKIVHSLRQRLGVQEDGKPAASVIDSAYIRNAHASTERRDLNYNTDGDRYSRGENTRIGFLSRIEDAGPFSFFLNPEYRHPDKAGQEENNLIARKVYGVYDFGWDLIAGRDSQWWGPGHHGALLLTNNAEPFTMVRIANPSPIRLPWIFNSLGPFGASFFVTNLEKARNIPEPYLWGMRFDFKPHRNLEIGLERTGMLGGRKGRPEDIGIWGRSLFGLNDADNAWGDTSREPGDQRAGLDVKLTIPSSLQPVQIYLEAAGEDEYRNMPSLWAFVSGVYLPGLFGNERFDLRCEWAGTRGRKVNPYIWYRNHLYSSGYTYRGNIIGHHMGSDSEDIFIELSYLMPERNARMFVFYDREVHNVYDYRVSHERKQETGVGMDGNITHRIHAAFRISRGVIDNPGNVPLADYSATQMETSLSYVF